MQRGRDHGIPGYNEWRQWSGQQRACDWNTPPSNIREDLWQKFYREGGLALFYTYYYWKFSLDLGLDTITMPSIGW